MDHHHRPRRGGRRDGRGRGPRRDGPPPWLLGAERRDRLPWRSTVLVTVVAVAGTGAVAHAPHPRTDIGALPWALLFAAALPLVLRHRHPVAVALTVAAAVTVYLGAGGPYGPVFLALVVACFAAVLAGRRAAAWAAMALVWTGHALVGHWLYASLPPVGDRATSWSGDTGLAAWLIAALAASEAFRVRREQWARERQERAAAERRRRDEERLRIARELHDVLAHSISVINVQAGVGLALLDSDPEQARFALTTIKAASKEALGEVRQVLDTLRAPGDAPRAPAPGLARLPELVEQAGHAGLTVRTVVDGAPEDLPPGADLAAFRIVQEALTNVVRHSGARTATVTLRHAPGRLDLRVEDPGPATAGDAGGTGNGLVGMRERAAALGGTLDAGALPDGGFEVRAELPYARGSNA